MTRKLIYLPLLALLLGCTADPAKKEAFTKGRLLQAYIMSPAGTANLLHYNAATGKIAPVLEAGHEQQLNFLPYPGNYGFIPGTLADTTRGGDGEPLDVLVLAQSVEKNTFHDIVPISVVQLAYAESTDTWLIAVPARPSERIISATTYNELQQNYPAVKQLLQLWLTNGTGKGKARIMSWRDEKHAEAEVQKWLR